MTKTFLMAKTLFVAGLTLGLAGTFIAYVNVVGVRGLREGPLRKDQTQENHGKEETRHLHEQFSRSTEVSVRNLRLHAQDAATIAATLRYMSLAGCEGC